MLSDLPTVQETAKVQFLGNRKPLPDARIPQKEENCFNQNTIENFIAALLQKTGGRSSSAGFL